MPPCIQTAPQIITDDLMGLSNGPVVLHSCTLLKGFIADDSRGIVLDSISETRQDTPYEDPIHLRGGGSYLYPSEPQQQRQQPPPPPHPPRAYSVNNANTKTLPPPPPPRDPFAPPLPPTEVPLRFLRAGKGDPVEGRRRYQETLLWRKQVGMDTILKEPHEKFELIKQHYPHYFHLRGRNNEPVYYEKPAKTNLRALRAGGVDLDKLLRHYAMITEFGWQCVERDDMARSITVIDLQGIRLMDFAGECIDFVRKASAFTGAHYPERAGHVLVINVPSWFKVIWNVVKPMVDETTLQKISILRSKEEIFRAMAEKIPIENIPPEYGGKSMPLGNSPEEQMLWDMMRHNNAIAQGHHVCNGPYGQPPCPLCTFVPARSY